jgi:hypothetical protein
MVRVAVLVVELDIMFQLKGVLVLLAKVMMAQMQSQVALSPLVQVVAVVQEQLVVILVVVMVFKLMQMVL